MSKTVHLTIDGKKVQAQKGENIVDVAAREKVHIPTLCYEPGMKDCLGTCRVCTIRWKRHHVSACTLKAEEGMELYVDTEDLVDLRKALVELLFVEGNHFCPSCEKSGNCHLQALGYDLSMTAPRFHYRFNNRKIDYNADNILFEHNRCVLCKRCTDIFLDGEDKQVFFFEGKGAHLEVSMDIERANKLSESSIDELVELCPVGAILKKGKGFDVPIGKRKYDDVSLRNYIEGSDDE
jgi:[NiFe] hydrogenase diaphorase moiety small subunit